MPVMPAYAAAPIVRLLDQRLDAQTDLIEAELELGRAADVIGDLDALVTANPLRERIAGQLMRALAACGRTADALAVYDRLRRGAGRRAGRRSRAAAAGPAAGRAAR